MRHTGIAELNEIGHGNRSQPGESLAVNCLFIFNRLGNRPPHGATSSGGNSVVQVASSI